MADEARAGEPSPAAPDLADERPAVLIIGGLGSLSYDFTLPKTSC